MKILALIISILKITGIILLVILALILLLLLILFFSSIKFQVIAKVNREVKFIVNIKYLFGIVKFKYDYENKENFLKIFGKRLSYNEKKKIFEDISNLFNKEEEAFEEYFSELENNSNKEKSNGDNSQNTFFKKEKNLDNKKANQNTLNKIDNKNKLTQSQDQDTEDSKVETRKNLKKYNKIKGLKSQEAKENENILEIDKSNFFILCKKIYHYSGKRKILSLLKQLLKSIKIQKFKIDFEYGLENPCGTGKICGIISIILPLFPKKILKEIKFIPNFEEKIFIGTSHLKFRTNIFKILLPIVIFIYKPPIRNIIFKKGE